MEITSYWIVSFAKGTITWSWVPIPARFPALASASLPPSLIEEMGILCSAELVKDKTQLITTEQILPLLLIAQLCCEGVLYQELLTLNLNTFCWPLHSAWVAEANVAADFKSKLRETLLWPRKVTAHSASNSSILKVIYQDSTEGAHFKCIAPMDQMRFFTKISAPTGASEQITPMLSAVQAFLLSWFKLTKKRWRGKAALAALAHGWKNVQKAKN